MTTGADSGPAAVGCAGGGMPGISGCGRSFSLFANVTGSLPDGFTLPNRMFAMAGPPPMPGNHAASTPLTFAIHGMLTGPPVSSTTIVCGLAAATAATSASWSPGRASVAESRPSLIGWTANTMATSDAFASFAAAAGSLPSLNSIFAFGAFARMAFSGDEGK